MELVRAIRTIQDNESSLAKVAWELDHATRALADAIRSTESVYEKFAPKVPPGGRPEPNEADAIIRLRVVLRDVKPCVARALEQTRQMRALCFYSEPNPELRNQPALITCRALLAGEGWTNGEIARAELQREGVSTPSLSEIRTRANTIKVSLFRLRTRKAEKRGTLRK